MTNCAVSFSTKNDLKNIFIQTQKSANPISNNLNCSLNVYHDIKENILSNKKRVILPSIFGNWLEWKKY
jgi:hypothetical protein